jgi:hypothetical protein
MLGKDFTRDDDVSADGGERTNERTEHREARRTVRAGLPPVVLDREDSKASRFTIGIPDIVAPDRTYHLQIDLSESLVTITETIGNSRKRIMARICGASSPQGGDAMTFGSVLTDRECALRAEPAEADQPIQSAQNVFRKEGEYWTIIYRGEIFRLRDARGLHFLTHLLAHPGERYHATELIRAVELTAIDREKGPSCLAGRLQSYLNLGDAGPTLDPQARADYRRRIAELRAELLEADEINDRGRVERIHEELEFLTEELSAAVGLGGRARLSASHCERARVVVTRNIRATIKKVLVENPALGHHFNLSIKTGNFCAYLPEAEGKICWQN